jgi:hypothetical protein
VNYSKKIEKDTRRYSKINKCFVKDKPNAYLLAESIAYGEPLSNNLSVILNPEKNPKQDPPLPHHLAYAFYVIADEIGDSRADARKKWLLNYMQKEDAKEIEEFIEDKYLQSHLTKCFSINENYKVKIHARDLID